MTPKEFAEKHRGKKAQVQGTLWVGTVVGYHRYYDYIVLDVSDPYWTIMVETVAVECVLLEKCVHPGIVVRRFCILVENQSSNSASTATSTPKKYSPRCPRCGAYDFYQGFSEVSCSNPHCNPTLRR